MTRSNLSLSFFLSIFFRALCLSICLRLPEEPRPNLVAPGDGVHDQKLDDAEPDLLDNAHPAVFRHEMEYLAENVVVSHILN